jgi:polysaccharide export outer membrane protein
VLDVSVWRNADLSRVVPVRPDGFISLPMVGEVKAEGLSAEALAEEISGRLAPFVQAPHVSVILHEVNAARVYVTGEVIHPGAYPLRGRMSVVQALAIAGGLSPFAQGDQVVVLRTRGGSARYELSYAELVGPGEQGHPAPEAWLQPGDTLVVP